MHKSPADDSVGLFLLKLGYGGGSIFQFTFSIFHFLPHSISTFLPASADR